MRRRLASRSRWLLISGAFVAIAIADSFYLVAEAEGGYVPGAVFDLLWPFGAVALGAAAWLPAQRNDVTLPPSARTRRAPRFSSTRGAQFDPAVAHAIVELMDEGLCADVEFALPLDPGLALV